MKNNIMIKTKRPKNKEYSLTEKEVADIVGCSISLVKKVRVRMPINSVQAKTIIAIDDLANERKTLLIDTLKEL